MVAIVSAVLIAVIVIAFLCWVFISDVSIECVDVNKKDILIAIPVVLTFFISICLCVNFRLLIALFLFSYLRAHWLIIKYRCDIYTRKEEIKNARKLGWTFCLPMFVLGFTSYFYSWMFVFAYCALCLLSLCVKDNESYIEGTETSFLELYLCSCAAAVFAIIPYCIFQIWWGLFGSWLFDGPFSNDTGILDIILSAGFVVFGIIYIVFSVIEAWIRNK